MKQKLFISIILFNFYALVNSIDLNTIIKTGALIASNYNSISYIKNIFNAQQKLKNVQDVELNNHPNYKKTLEQIMHQCDPNNKNILIYHCRDDEHYLKGNVFENKILLNTLTTVSISKETTDFKNFEPIAKSIIRHEIGHIENDHLRKLDKAQTFTKYSSLALIPIFQAISEDTHTNLLTKCGSMVALATTKCLFDKIYIALKRQQFEKEADQYAIKHARSEELESMAGYYGHLAKGEPQSFFINLFDTHPPLMKRSQMFASAAKDKKRIELLQEFNVMKKQLKNAHKPLSLHNKIPSSLDDID
jgi:hypothetical protein